MHPAREPWRDHGQEAARVAGAIDADVAALVDATGDASGVRAGTGDPSGSRQAPLVAIVSSAEIAEQGTLSADYWVNREPGETWTAFRVRRQLEDLERRAQGHDEAARKLREQAEELRRTTNQ
jgi:hypothetical protein